MLWKIYKYENLPEWVKLDEMSTRRYWILAKYWRIPVASVYPLSLRGFISLRKDIRKYRLEHTEGA